MATTTTLPTMTGTEKQIAYAIDIRRAALTLVERFISTSEQRTGKSRNDLPQLTAAVARLSAKASASWWIERRDLLGDNDTIGQRWLADAMR